MTARSAFPLSRVFLAIGGGAGALTVVGLIFAAIQMAQAARDSRDQADAQATLFAIQSTISANLGHQLELQVRAATLSAAGMIESRASTQVAAELARVLCRFSSSMGPSAKTAMCCGT